ncbi:MAG: lysophospholipid acyltransferase family protein [Bacteroidota bacterium]
MNQVPSPLTYVSSYDPKLRRKLIGALELATGRKKIQQRYDQLQAMELAPIDIWRTSLTLLEVEPVLDPVQLAKVPSEGPLVFIANHPFGVVDGLILGDLVARVRTKFSILVNEVLCRQDERMNEFLLPVDFQESKRAIRTNLATRQKALEQLAQGHAVAIFPSGGVATSPRAFAKAEDLDWKRFTAKLIQKSKATVVPVFFHGRNSRLFQIASHVHETLRMGMLLNEVRNKMGRQIRLTVGDPIPFEALAPIRDRQALIDELRKITFELGKQ